MEIKDTQRLEIDFAYDVYVVILFMMTKKWVQEVRDPTNLHDKVLCFGWKSFFSWTIYFDLISGATHVRFSN